MPVQADSRPALMATFITRGGASVLVTATSGAVVRYRWRCYGCDAAGDAATVALADQHANHHATTWRCAPRVPTRDPETKLPVVGVFHTHGNATVLAYSDGERNGWRCLGFGCGRSADGLLTGPAACSEGNVHASECCAIPAPHSHQDTR